MKFFEKITIEFFHASHILRLLSNYWEIIVISIWKICEILRRILFDNPNMSDLEALTRIEICHNRRFYDICFQLLIAELYLCWYKKDFVTFLSFNIVYAVFDLSYCSMVLAAFQRLRYKICSLVNVEMLLWN